MKKNRLKAVAILRYKASVRYKQYEEQLAKTRKANKEQEAATAVPEV